MMIIMDVKQPVQEMTIAKTMIMGYDLKMFEVDIKSQCSAYECSAAEKV